MFEQAVVRNSLSLMASCGMYDYSGEFAFNMGFPAKSGVGGAVLVVIPGIMGICTFSPRLDAIGNSVRGVEFCHRLAKKYAFHAYDGATQDKKNPTRWASSFTTEQSVAALLWAASEGNKLRVMHWLMRGVNVNGADYDGRTGLHLAASHGHLDVVKYLVANGANVDLKDRFGNTPLADAKREKHKDVSQFLSFKTGSVSLQGKNQRMIAVGSTDGVTISKELLLQAIECVGVPRTDQRIEATFDKHSEVRLVRGLWRVVFGRGGVGLSMESPHARVHMHPETTNTKATINTCTDTIYRQTRKCSIHLHASTQLTDSSVFVLPIPLAILPLVCAHANSNWIRTHSTLCLPRPRSCGGAWRES